MSHPGATLSGVLIRYVDGPYEGDTVETTCLEIEGTFIEDGAAWQVRYRVDRPNFTAREVWRGPLGSLDPKMLDPGPPPLTLVGASTEQVLAELKRRADGGDPVAAGYLRPSLSTPMGGRRAPRPRAGFGQTPR